VNTGYAPVNMSWLLDTFIDQVPGIAHVVAVSADGLLIAGSRGLPADRAEQLAAVTAGLVSLGQGVSQCTDGGQVLQTECTACGEARVVAYPGGLEIDSGDDSATEIPAR